MLKAYLNSTIYILVHVILSVSHVADLLHCRYILSHPGTALYVYIQYKTATALTSA